MEAMRQIRQSRLFLGAMLLTLLASAVAGEDLAPQREVEAAFILNLPEFVEWPENAFSTHRAPLVIGVLGDESFQNTFEDLARNKTLHKRHVQVRRIHSTNEMNGIQMMVMEAVAAPALAQWLAELKDRAVLTVGDADGFVHGGGMIRLIFEGSKIKFRVNETALKKANIQVSAKLLQMADIIQ